MADKTSIEWTDATWQIITGCSVVSPGCTNCYAMRLAGGRLRNHPSRKGLTIPSKAGPVWNGEVRFNEKWLDQPLKWSKPRTVFVCAHGDLFHENVPDEWIDKVFAVMGFCSQHTFQVLTKRAERMRKYLDHFGSPLRNVWLGVSAERQEEADERIPHLLQTPAAVRFLSAEPLLGPIILHPLGDGTNALTSGTGPNLNWLICGGESGPHARPMHPRWARDLRDQCQAAGCAFFFKQFGEYAPTFYDTDEMVRVGKKAAGRLLDGREWNEMPR